MINPPVEALLKRIAADLNAADIPFAVVGGLAVGARAEPRFTADVDVALSVVDDTEAEKVISRIIHLGYRPIMELDQDAVGRLATMRLVAPSDKAFIEEGRPIVDVICATCGIEQELVGDATIAPLFPGIQLPTATVPYLIAMKLLSESDQRMKDRWDLQSLFGVALADDVAMVPSLIDLMVQRGYGRDMDLPGKFERFKDKWA